MILVKVTSAGSFACSTQINFPLSVVYNHTFLSTKKPGAKPSSLDEVTNLQNFAVETAKLNDN